MRGSRSIPMVAVPFFLLVVFAPRSAADPSPGLSLQLDSLFETVPYATFEWSAKKGVSERAAMRVPVTLDGEERWFQVDTGLDVTQVYGRLADERGWEAYGFTRRVSRMESGGIDLGPVWVHTKEDFDGGRLSGSIGLDLFFGHLVLIDFPGRRVALMDYGDAPARLLERTQWTYGDVRNGKFFVNIVLNRTTLTGVFFDTGSSAFPLTVDFDRWCELTERTSPNEATIEWKMRSWGHDVTALGAPAAGDLVIGSLHIPHPPVFFLKENPSLFASWPFPAEGLVGNAPFWDDVVLLDLGMIPRLGVVR